MILEKERRFTAFGDMEFGFEVLGEFDLNRIRI